MGDPRKGRKYFTPSGQLVVFLYAKQPNWDYPDQEEEVVVKHIGKGYDGEQENIPFWYLKPARSRRRPQALPSDRGGYSCPHCRTSFPNYRGPEVECPGCGGVGESFREWLLNEMAVVSLPRPLATDDGVIDAIDLRLEDYPKTTQTEKNQLIQLMFHAPFYGKFPGSSKYFVFDGEDYTIDFEPPPSSFIKLPDFWWDFAVGYRRNKVVKRPRKARIYD